MNTNDDLIDVRDLGLTAALICANYQPVGTRRDLDGRVYFFFLKSSDLDAAIGKYWVYSFAIDARQYSEALKAVKSQIYNEKTSK